MALQSTFSTGCHLDGLLSTIAGEKPRAQAGPGLSIGHVHLHVGDLQRGLGFYRDVLGFELMTLIPGEAAFVSAGAYHHHLGFNLWRGEGVPPAPAGRVGLRCCTVVLDDSEEVEAVRERAQDARWRYGASRRSRTRHLPTADAATPRVL